MYVYLAIFMQFCFLSKKLNISKTSSLCSSDTCSLRIFELWYFLWKIFYAKPYFCIDLINKTNLYNLQLYLRPRRKAWVARPLAIVKVLQQKYRLNGFRQVEHKMVREINSDEATIFLVTIQFIETIIFQSFV